MKKLVVYYSINTMSKDVAQKPMETKKQYRREKRRRDFEPDTDPEFAIHQILEEFGEKPSRSLSTAHSFADILDWKVQEVFERPPEAIVQYIDQELLPPSMLAACIVAKDSDRPF